MFTLNEIFTMPLTNPQIRRARILVIEDEQGVREATVSYFQMEGLSAIGASTLKAAENLLSVDEFDLLVVDLGLPDGDAQDWLSQRTDLMNKGIIITTARAGRSDRIAGLQAGADGYLVKPVDLDELVYTVKNLLRRLHEISPKRWTLDTLNWRLLPPNEAPIKLTHSELVLLGATAAQPGEVVSRDQLVLLLGEDPIYYDWRRLEILIRRMRNKVSDAVGYDLPFETIRGQGYAFTAPISVTNG